MGDAEADTDQEEEPLFQDDFSSSSTGWLLASDEEGNHGTKRGLDQIDFLDTKQIKKKRRRPNHPQRHSSSQKRRRSASCSLPWLLIGAMTSLSLLVCLVLAILLQNCRTGTTEEPSNNSAVSSSGRLANLSSECREYPWNHLRLPDSLVPLLYDLWLYPNLDTLTFSGNVRIRLKVFKETNLIVLNKKHIAIRDFNATIVSSDGEEWPVMLRKYMECALLEQASWLTESALSKGSRLILSLSFHGNITNDFAGLYRSSFRDPQGNVFVSAVTQFESTDARAMFPCWDEPAMKAKFKVSLVRKESQRALANMPLESSQPYKDGSDADLVVDSFDSTVKMSTYLLAVAVGDFANISAATSSGTKVSVFAPVAQIEEGSFALEVGIKGLEYLGLFFGIPFPLPKQDLLAVSDFSSGAMENWGLVTFRDQILLWNPSESSTSAKELTATVIIHELAHQGASVIHMIMEIGGEEVFRKGLGEYLSVHKYGNAKGEDLWNILDKHISTEAGLSLPDVATAWTHQVGYPLIKVRLSNDRRSVFLVQERFLYSKEARETANATHWPVPLNFRTDYNATYSKIWLKNGTENKLDFEKPLNWAKLNLNGNGFYRVLYEHSIYESIIGSLRSDPTELSSGDRASLIYDAFSFSKAGLLPITTAMNMIEYISSTGKETEYLPLSITFGQLRAVENMIWGTDSFLKFRKLETRLVEKVYKEVGWDIPSDHSRKLLQEEVLSEACRIELPPCLLHAKEEFHKWLHNESYRLPADLKSLIVKAGVRYGNMSVWDAVYERYGKSVLPSEQSLYLGALAETRDPWLLARYLLMVLDADKVKPNLMNKVLGRIARNPGGKLMAWRFLREKWTDILDRVGLTSMLGNAIKVVVQEFSTEFDYNEVKKFFADKDLGKNKRKLEESLETIEIHTQWRRLNEEKLKDWLGKKPELNM